MFYLCCRSTLAFISGSTKAFLIPWNKCKIYPINLKTGKWWIFANWKKMIKIKPATSHRRIGLPSQEAPHSPAPELKLKRYSVFNIYFEIWFSLREHYRSTDLRKLSYSWLLLLVRAIGSASGHSPTEFLPVGEVWWFCGLKVKCWVSLTNMVIVLPRVFCGKAPLEGWGDLRVSQIRASLDGLIDPVIYFIFWVYE